MKDALDNINKNPNSRAQKTHKTTSARIQTLEHERHHELCKETKTNVSTKLAKAQILKKVKFAKMWNILKPKLMQEAKTYT
jgi:hypothetical protein